MKFEDSNAQVAVNSAHGIYVAKVFAEKYKRYLEKTESGLMNGDLAILLEGPDHPDYVEVFSTLFPITLKDEEGNLFVFDQVGDSGDVWEIRKEEYDQIEWEEI